MPFFQLEMTRLLNSGYSGRADIHFNAGKEMMVKRGSLKGLRSTRDPQAELGTFPHQNSIVFVDSFEAIWQQRNKLCLSKQSCNISQDLSTHFVYDEYSGQL